MLADLQKLAGRKLGEGRRHAGSNIDRWEAMLNLISQLAEQAEVAIETSQQFLTDITKARSELTKAGYLAALKIAEAAAASEMESKARAKERLGIAERERAAAVSTIRNEIILITAKRDAKRSAADRTKRAEIEVAETRKPAHMPELDFSKIARTGFSYGLLIVVGSLISAIAVSANLQGSFQSVEIIFSIIWGILWVFGVSGFLTFPLVAVIYRVLTRTFRQSKAASNAKAHVKEANRSFKATVAQADKEFCRDIVAPQSALPKAEAHWQKVVQAINRLEQCQRHLQG